MELKYVEQVGTTWQLSFLFPVSISPPFLSAPCEGTCDITVGRIRRLCSVKVEIVLWPQRLPLVEDILLLAGDFFGLELSFKLC